MKTRIITAIFIVAVMLPILIFSEYIVYPIALAIFSLFATFEVYRVIGIEKKWVVAIPAYLISFAAPLCTHEIFLGQDFEKSNYILITVAAIFVYLLYIMGAAVFSKGSLTVATISKAFLVFTYVVISFTSLSLIRYLEYGNINLFLVFIAAWGCDTFAYFTGYLFGKHKLIPEISPKKTVEGAIGGVVFAVIFFILYGIVIEAVTDAEANYIVLSVSGFILAIVSQIGDLIASLIKREHGVKDYSNLLPGHGGIMDRFDSILSVATPLIAICIIFPPFT